MQVTGQQRCPAGPAWRCQWRRKLAGAAAAAGRLGGVSSGMLRRRAAPCARPPRTV